jgi:hypothetical protein
MRGSALAFEVAPGFKGTGTSSQALPAPSTSCSLTADLNAAVAKHTLQAIAEKVIAQLPPHHQRQDLLMVCFIYEHSFIYEALFIHEYHLFVSFHC